jgi:hypothetical protein
MLLSYFTFPCLVDLICLHYVPWYRAQDFMSSEKITESKKVSSPMLQTLYGTLCLADRASLYISTMKPT